MSKRSWLPTRKGTELQPQTNQAPTKLVIRDVPAGTPLHDAVVQQFGGQLKQFHGKAQQDYSLSGNQQYRRHIEWTGARATYTNQFGHETLELEVNVPVLEELQKALPGTVPDYAVIDIIVRDSEHLTGLEFEAALITPSVVRTDFIETGTPINGIELSDPSAHDYSYHAELVSKTAIIKYADADAATGHVAIPNFVASLRVDLRDLGEHSDVTIDLYGSIAADPDTTIDLPPVLIGTYPSASIDFAGQTVLGGSSPSGWSDYNLTEMQTLYPDVDWSHIGLESFAGVWGVGPSIDDVKALTLSYSYARGVGYPFSQYYYASGLAPTGWEGDPTSGPNVYRSLLQPERLGDVVAFPLDGRFIGSIRWRMWRRCRYNSDGSFSSFDPFPNDTDAEYPDPPSPPDDINYVPDGSGPTGWTRFQIVDRGFYYAPIYDYPTMTVHHPKAATCDLAYAFYERGTTLFEDTIISDEPAAIWTATEGATPRRTKFGKPIALSSESGDTVTIDNPYGMQFLGRVTIDRATRSVGWKPADV